MLDRFQGWIRRHEPRLFGLSVGGAFVFAVTDTLNGDWLGGTMLMVMSCIAMMERLKRTAPGGTDG